MPAEMTPAPRTHVAPLSRLVIGRAVLTLTCLVALASAVVFLITPGPASSAPRPAIVTAVSHHQGAGGLAVTAASARGVAAK